MMRKLIFVAASLIAVLSSAPGAFAQSRDIMGTVMPMAYGDAGERHWRDDGYTGPFVPALASEKIATKVAHSHSQATSSLSHGAHTHAALVGRKHAAALSEETEWSRRSN
jgi:hypothetical protein